jgi:hypothetical protein
MLWIEPNGGIVAFIHFNSFSVWRWATGCTIGVLGFDSRRGLGIFSLHYRVQNGSGAYPASCPMGTRGCFPGRKAAGA